MKPLDRIFHRPELLEQALTHKSYHNENLHSSSGHNERLEFLGDAVLDLALSDILMTEFPEMTEGELSKTRASLVNEAVLAELASEHGLAVQMRLGKGELRSRGQEKPRLLASVLEAYAGAVYLDSGFAEAYQWVLRVFKEKLKNLDLQYHYSNDFKTRLQECLQRDHGQAPIYETIKTEGPDHERMFTVEVRIADQVLGRGEGRSKKLAEQEAARIALEKVK